MVMSDTVGAVLANLQDALSMSRTITGAIEHAIAELGGSNAEPAVASATVDQASQNRIFQVAQEIVPPLPEEVISGYVQSNTAVQTKPQGNFSGYKGGSGAGAATKKQWGLLYYMLEDKGIGKEQGRTSLIRAIKQGIVGVDQKANPTKEMMTSIIDYVKGKQEFRQNSDGEWIL